MTGVFIDLWAMLQSWNLYDRKTVTFECRAHSTIINEVCYDTSYSCPAYSMIELLYHRQADTGHHLLDLAIIPDRLDFRGNLVSVCTEPV